MRALLLMLTCVLLSWPTAKLTEVHSIVTVAREARGGVDFTDLRSVLYLIASHVHHAYKSCLLAESYPSYVRFRRGRTAP